MKYKLKKAFKPKLELVKGTRFISFFFIAFSVMIAAGILFASNMYYNIDTSEVVLEEIQRVTGVIRATAGIIVGGSSSQDPESGVGLELASDDLLLSAASQVLRFSGGTSYYVGLQGPTTVTSSVTYTLPNHGLTPPGENYILSWQAGNQLAWSDIGDLGGGSITAVGNITSGAAFTAITPGEYLYFKTAGTHAGQLTVAGNLAEARTYTLPDASGTLTVGSGTTNHIAYWSGANTLASEAQLATSRGGTGQNSSAWNGMVQVVGGAWGAVTGQTGYATYWSDANTIASEQYLSVSRGGTGVGTFTSNGILYGNGTSAVQATSAGSLNQILLGTAGAPGWGSISDLLTAGSNIASLGTGTTITIATVMNPTFSTSVTSPQFLSTTTLAIQSGNSQDITIDSSSGRILLGAGDWIETSSGYQIGKAGTEVLREMIPIMGFDLPIQTATTSFVDVSRVIEKYPFAVAATGTERVHKLVFRYSASTTQNIPFRVYTSSEYALSNLPVPASTDLAKGEAYIVEINIPTSTTAWHLQARTQNVPDTVRIFQVFLAAYDRIQ